MLIPSLWWESFPRVSIEAIYNNIPTITSNRGGLPEALGHAGIVQSFDAKFFKAPYNKMPSNQDVAETKNVIEKLYDNPDYYADAAALTEEQAKKHSIENSTQRLITELNRLCP
jgi:glycosyltransferase involved in cell wall biosynthesis